MIPASIQDTAPVSALVSAPGIDFHETYSPTVKCDSLQIILAPVAALDLHMRQFDIMTAFLYGSIQ